MIDTITIIYLTEEINQKWNETGDITLLLARAKRYNPIRAFRSATKLFKYQFRIIICLTVWKMLWSIDIHVILETMRMNDKFFLWRGSVNRHWRLTFREALISSWRKTGMRENFKLGFCACVVYLSLMFSDASIHPLGRERSKSNMHKLSLCRMQLCWFYKAYRDHFQSQEVLKSEVVEMWSRTAKLPG